MSSNKNKLKKIDYPWESKGVDYATLARPIVGISSIAAGKTPPNPNPRVVYCLGCNQWILPSDDAYCTNYKGQFRYICESCFVGHGFVW